MLRQKLITLLAGISYPKGYEIIVIVLTILSAHQFACADNARDFVTKGNNLYNASQFTEAIDQYDLAGQGNPTAFEPKFNKANSYFRLDDFDTAIDLYRQVASSSKDMQLVEQAKYNLGNCFFARGSNQKASDPQKSLEDFRAAIPHWRSALEINPDNTDAARNIEVARLTIKDILDKINKQKQAQQAQQKKRKEQIEKLKELADKQESLSQQTQDTEDKLEKDQIDQQSANEKFQQLSQQQNQLKNETAQIAEELQQDQTATEAAKEVAESASAQQDAADKLSQSKSEPAKQSQAAASDHIEKAIEALTKQDQQQQQQEKQQDNQEQENQQSQDKQSQQQQQSQQDGDQAEPPDKTAAQILEKEQRDKKTRQTLRPGRQKVEKDW